MSEKTRRIRVEFGPFRVVLEGFERSVDGIDMTVQLIRSLSSQKIVAGLNDDRPAPKSRTSGERARTDQKQEKPLFLQEEATTEADPSTVLDVPEFHTIRLDLEKEPKGPSEPRQWQTDIERLEASARQAMTTLTERRDDSGIAVSPNGPPQAAAAPEPTPPVPVRESTPPVSGGDTPLASASRPETQSRLDEEAAARQPEETDGFAPRSIANSGNWPEDAPEAVTPGSLHDDQAPAPYAAAQSTPETSQTGTGLEAENKDGGESSDREIRKSLDINRLAIEKAASKAEIGQSHVNGSAHDYLAMEDEAIDRLLETTNALLETDDHTRKNQSLDRQKAAVLATEAERRIKVKTKSGTVTLDFDEKGGTRHPVADLLAAPSIDPEKRRERLQAYRTMISDHKKRS